MDRLRRCKGASRGIVRVHVSFLLIVIPINTTVYDYPN